MPTDHEMGPAGGKPGCMFQLFKGVRITPKIFVATPPSGRDDTVWRSIFWDFQCDYEGLLLGGGGGGVMTKMLLRGGYVISRY